MRLSDDRDTKLARIDGRTLIVENIGWPEPAVDDIVVSSVVVLTKVKKSAEEAEAMEGMSEVNQALAGT